MNWSKQQEFNSFLIEKEVVGFFDAPITLKSGRKSNWYMNFRSIAEDAKRLDILSDYVVDFVNYLIASGKLKDKPLCFYGVPEGATKTAIIAQMKWAKIQPDFAEGSHPVPMGRARPKEHGMPKDKFFVGAPRGSTLVLEDVTTTAGSLVTCIKSLLEAEVSICATVGFANRMEKRDDGLSAEQVIATLQSGGKPLQYFYMSSAVDLLPLAAKRLNPKAEVLRSIEEEFSNWGVSALRF